MTKKDYVKLADALLSARNEAKGQDQLFGVGLALLYVSHILEKDNPRFDRERFYKASGQPIYDTFFTKSR